MVILDQIILNHRADAGKCGATGLAVAWIAAYPVYLAAYEERRQRFARDTGVAGLYSVGRNGEFAHLLMEDVYWRTLRKTAAIADYVLEGARHPDGWTERLLIPGEAAAERRSRFG